jgi:hypothetical protein
MIGEVSRDLLESRALARWAPVIAFGVAAVASCCVCCTGGLFDALSPPVAIGFLSAAVVCSVAAAVLGTVRILRPFRAVRDEVTERMERFMATQAEAVRDDGGAVTVVGYRITRTFIDTWNGDTEAQVVTVLTFDDGTKGTLRLVLVPHAEGWDVGHLYGAGFRIPLE